MALACVLVVALTVVVVVERVFLHVRLGAMEVFLARQREADLQRALFESRADAEKAKHLGQEQSQVVSDLVLRLDTLDGRLQRVETKGALQ